MKDIKHFLFTGMILFFISLNSNFLFSQSFEKSLRSKLAREDQQKYLKCDNLMAKGYAIIENNPYLPDSVSKKNKTSYIHQNHQITAYYMSHLDASLNFKFAIELKYEVLNKNIKAFWKKYKGKMKNVDWLVKIDNACFDSLEKADQIRQEADYQTRLYNKIPLLKQAESIEEDALLRMEKILFIMQNFPVDPIPEWLASNDTLDPLLISPLANASPPKAPLSDSILKALPVKDTSFYSLLHIGEQQVDLFNNFLLEKFPEQIDSFLMDFEKLKPSKIDSLQEEWNNFVLGQYVTGDTSLSSAKLKKNPPVRALAHLLKDTKIKIEVAKKPGGQVFKPPAKEVALNPPAATAKKFTLNPPAIPAKEDTLNHPALNENPKTVNKASGVDVPNFFYKVQIAACRDKLSSQELKHRYNDPQNVVVTYEDEWYKYTLGSFSDYNSARELRDKVNIKGAFVVAYLNGRRIQITPYAICKKHSQL